LTDAGSDRAIICGVAGVRQAVPRAVDPGFTQVLTMRFALVQAGAQAAAIVRVAPRLRGGAITAVVDSDAAAAERLAGQLGAAIWTTSAERLHQQHDDAFDTWVAVTSAGLLIVPHDNRPLELKSASWLNYPAAWLWGHTFRFLPSVVTVKESLKTGKLGAPGLVRIHHWQTQAAGDCRQALLPQLDVACWLVDQPPSMLFAQSRSAEPAAAHRDYLQVHLGFADDRMAIIDCATSLAKGDDYYSLSVIGASGAAYADDHHNVQLLYGGGHPQAVRTSQGDKALLATLQEFIDAAAHKRPPRCGAAEWKRAQRLIEAVDQSLSSGQAVALTGGST
jgi:predicted dehydrogenase